MPTAMIRPSGCRASALISSISSISVATLPFPAKVSSGLPSALKRIRPNLPDDEFRLYQRLFDIIHQQLVHPDIVVYLHAPVQKLQQNIKKRNRPYEQKIPDAYLFSIQETYTNYIRQHNIKTIFVDASNADFFGNEKHLQAIINALDKEYTDGQHYLTLP